MGACPFCQGEVDDDILTFGGRCPQCLIEIPGEEAPTDPGADARAAEAAAEAAKDQTSSTARIAAVLVVGALAAGAAFVVYTPAEAPMEPIPTGSDAYKKVSGQFLTIDLDDEEEATPTPEPKKPAPKPKKPKKPKVTKPAAGIGAALPDTNKLGADDSEIATIPLSDAGGAAVPDVPSLGEDPNAALDSPRSAGVLSAPAPRRKSSLNDIGVGGGPRESIQGIVLCGSSIKDGAREVMRKVGTQFSACADRMLKKDEKFSAAVRVSIKVEKTGNIAAIDLQPSKKVDNELLDCMNKVLAKTKFSQMCEAIDLSKSYQLGR
ncbi:MAG TPA: hypothetical protein DFR83_28540 [Deltaproteobacteria bacterium]|nr:hypothetical protein [Deltaproteobacteria bacterium]